MTRYQELADDIEASITAGVLCPGDKLPSVRQTSERRGVSASTVFQAYYLLEARGLVRARERSGYFVAQRPRSAPPEPTEPSSPEGDSFAVVDVSERVFEVLESAMDRDVVPLGSAFPSPGLFPLRRLGQCLAHAAREADPRSAIDDLTPGSLALRRQIARRYLADGLALTPADLVITNGALEALNLCLAAVTRPGGAVVIESPCFYGALQALERMGLSAIEVPTHPGEGMDLAALEAALQRHRPQAIWLMTCFQNPLGSLMPEARKRALVELVTRHRVPLIEDDVYGELYFGERRPPPAKTFDTEGWVLHCSSFSKWLAPGWRTGWAAPGRFTRAVARQKLTTTLATNAPTQQALADYLESGGADRHLRRLRQSLALQRDHMASAIARHFPQGTRATRPEGGYFMWIELPPYCNALALHRAALARGISVAPGPIFSASQAFGHCLRLNYGHDWSDETGQALATLGELARAMQPRPTAKAAR
ncbi:PLP-dependent aminotransferase family protein [Delftia acidovorans]|uniref:aminotransferase-like domain-containing protein n=1 Tax=Delftia acidovorans TaxID=80866 RepID=UPI000BC362B1|nr:PLP-dependent aminotransferase family protein [Delftia acidovorans]ATH14496.1 GntR family transcriptional regulator [Delftia acidovorans]MCG8990478.1 PLP-dependent aminotransferase family protein [Delftia acidovorans]